MSIKVENLVRITTDGSYLLLTPEEYRALTGQTSAPVALKDMRIAELEKEVKEWQRVSMEKDQLLAWADKNTSEDVHNFKVVRDKQREEIAKLREELAKTRGHRDDLQAEIDAMTLKAKGMVEKTYWRDLIAIPEERCPACGERGVHSCPGLITDHGTAEVLRELLDEGDIEPVEPTEPPALENMPQVTPEPETVPEPVFNDTAVTAEEATQKYPAKKKGFGVPAKNPFTAEQKEKYIALMRTNIPRKDIIAAMAKDSEITLGNANSRYYALLQSITTDQAIKELDERTKKPEPVAKPRPAPIKRVSSLPAGILEQLDTLPIYPTAMQFKDAVCLMHDMSQYSVAQLKVAYKETHKNLTW